MDHATVTRLRDGYGLPERNAPDSYHSTGVGGVLKVERPAALPAFRASVSGGNEGPSRAGHRRARAPGRRAPHEKASPYRVVRPDFGTPGPVRVPEMGHPPGPGYPLADLTCVRRSMGSMGLCVPDPVWHEGCYRNRVSADRIGRRRRDGWTDPADPCGAEEDARGRGVQGAEGVGCRGRCGRARREPAPVGFFAFGPAGRFPTPLPGILPTPAEALRCYLAGRTMDDATRSGP